MATLETPQFEGGFQKTLKAKKGGMLLFPALGGLRDEDRHGQKTEKFWEILYEISIINISASKQSI